MSPRYSARMGAALALLGLGLAGTVQAQTIVADHFRPYLVGPDAEDIGLFQYDVSITGVTTPDSSHFLNIVRDDGTWVIQNLPIAGLQGDSNLAVTFGSEGFTEGGTYSRTVSAAPVTIATFDSTTSFTAHASPYTTWLSNETQGIAGGDSPPDVTPPVPAPGQPGSPKVVVHQGVPDIPQGPYECVPTSTANSIVWMESKYKFDTGFTGEQIRDRLKSAQYMNTKTPQFPGDNVTGTSFENWIDGKNAFVSDYDLPIISTFTRKPTASYLESEIDDGCDVEFSYNWTRINKITGQVTTGEHAVTMTGYTKYPGGTQFFYNDPADGFTGTRVATLGGTDDAPSLTYVRVGGGVVLTIDITAAMVECDEPEPGIVPFALVAVGTLSGLVIIRRKRGS